MDKAKKNNQGFSLIELIVTMALMAIVGLAIFGFLSFCMNQYRHVHYEVRLQSKAQIVMNQIDNRMVNASEAIGVDSPATGEQLWLIERKVSSTTKDAKGNDVNNYTYSAVCIFHDASAKEVYLQRYNCTKTDVGYTMSSADPKESLVGGVTKFDVGLPAKLKQKETVRIEIEVQENERTFTDTYEVTVRNDAVDASGRISTN